MPRLFSLSIFTISILASTLPAAALPTVRTERIQATCEFLDKINGEYTRDNRCFVAIHRTPILPSAIDFYWADGVVTRTTIASLALDFVGFSESAATIDDEPGRFLTTGASAMNCFEVTATKNRICYKAGWER